MRDKPVVRKIHAPWTEKMLAKLNDWQLSGRFHPYTCGVDSCRCILKPTLDGWVCPDEECDYTQDWAWGQAEHE